MLTRQVFKYILTCALVLFIAVSYTGCGTSTPPSFPTERLKLAIPGEFELTSPLTILQGQKVNIDSNAENYLFQNCEVWIVSGDTQISSSEFVNSQVLVEQKNNVVFDRVIFRDLNQYEETALRVSDSKGVVVANCQFIDNFIGFGIHSSSVEVAKNRFEGNNGHNALVIGEGSSAKVEGNYFYGSFPHAILIMNREGSTEAKVDITRNFIEQTGEDAINFEDYRNAAPSNVSNNVIVNSGWSALVVEYNSWGANVTIENNWIEGTGISWKLPTHSLQPERFQAGWGHGILIEDSSQVQVVNNRILSVTENGIEVKNSRDAVLQGNGLSCSQLGIGVHRYEEASLYRGFSPLAQENAGASQVTASDNTIYKAQKDYDVDEWSQLVIQ